MGLGVRWERAVRFSVCVPSVMCLPRSMCWVCVSCVCMSTWLVFIQSTALLSRPCYWGGTGTEMAQEGPLGPALPSG